MQISIKKWIVFSLCLLILLSLFSGCSKSAQVVAVSTTAPDTAPTTPPTMPHQMRSGVETMLIVSLKDFQPTGNSMSIRNNSKADLIMLMITDSAQKKMTSLQLNPNTVVSFTAPGTHDPVEIPLGEAISYGSGGSDSCLNLTKAVSNLLGGISIQHYMLFTLDSIGIVNDLIGGVDVEVSDPFPSQYPSLINGQTAHLMGSNALAFFDYRDASDLSGEAHMRRQQQYMIKAFPTFISRMQQEDFLTKLMVKVGEQLSTDLTPSQMIQIMELMGTCMLDETIHLLPGAADGANRFLVDSQAADSVINELFY